MKVTITKPGEIPGEHPILELTDAESDDLMRAFLDEFSEEEIQEMRDLADELDEEFHKQYEHP